MDIEIVPCSVQHLEQLIEGEDAFLKAYGLRAIPQAEAIAKANAPLPPTRDICLLEGHLSTF